MKPTQADIKLAIATIESVEQDLDVVRKAVAHDACCPDASYHHLFNNMINHLRECRDRLNSVERSESHTCT